MKKFIFCALILLLFVTSTNAALLRGSVYDTSLDKTNNVIISINSNPKQVIIAESGDYEFNLIPGNYTIKADYYENQVLGLSATNSINIEKEKGFYQLDLILLPSIEEELDENILNINPYDDYFESNFQFEQYNIIFLLLMFIIILYGLHRKFNNKHKNKKIKDKEVKDKNIEYKQIKHKEIDTNKEIKEIDNNKEIKESKIENKGTEHKIIKEAENNKELNNENSIHKTTNHINKEIHNTEKENNNNTYSINTSKVHPIAINIIEETKIDTTEEKTKSIPDKVYISYHEKLVKEVIDFIKTEGGSTTQKDIRKNFTSSEAKISLVITELVHKGKIEKIKKGRANIIVLKSGEDEIHRKDSK